MSDPTASRTFLTKALFDLINVKTWKDMMSFVENYAPYQLPYRKHSLTIGDYLGYGDYVEDCEASYPKWLDGNIGNARFDFGLGNADDYLRPLLPHAKALLEIRERKQDVGYDSVAMDLDAHRQIIDNELGVDRIIIDVEKILRHRDMLSETLLMYSVAIGESPVEAIEGKFTQVELGNGLVRIQYSCEWLISRYSFPEIWRGSHDGNGTFGALFDGSITVDDMKKMGIWFNDEILATSCVYLFDPSREAKGDSAILYGARMLASFFINANIGGLFGEYVQPKMGSSLHFEAKSNPNALFEQIWYEVGTMVDGRERIKTCKVCNRPLMPKRRSGYCSPTCKTQATNKRREAAIKYAVLGVPIDEAVREIGEKYRLSIEKWYAETLGTSSVR